MLKKLLTQKETSNRYVKISFVVCLFSKNTVLNSGETMLY